MNKAPLQTTSLAVVALAVLASPASAKFEVGISGYMEQWFGYSDNTDTSNPNSDVFDEVSDVLFAVEFSQEFENGIELGGAIEVLGHQGAADNIDGQSLYIEGSFGQLSVGTGDGASAAMHLGAVSNGIGLDDGDASIWVAGADGALSITSATSNIDGGANKVTYYSPRINGLQIGASFMPDADDVNAVTPVTAGQEVDARRDNSFAVAAHYERTMGEFTMSGSIGFMDAGGGVAGNETALAGGIHLGFGGFMASFAYGEHEDDTAVSDKNIFGASLAYSTEAAGVSVAYVRGEDSDTNDEQDSLEVGASYSIGPGVTASTSLYYVERVTAGNTTADGVAVVGGLTLTF